MRNVFAQIKYFYIFEKKIDNNRQRIYKMILEQLEQSPEAIEFNDVIAYVDSNYDFTPTEFRNGNTVNEAGQNNGSCKVFSFAKVNNLSKENTLNLFGAFYREDVLKNPEGTDHQNIRNFIEFGWDGIAFEGEALKKK
ncbi:HopJ type III effector protein [Elizabethkingia occulta]